MVFDLIKLYNFVFILVDNIILIKLILVLTKMKYKTFTIILKLLLKYRTVNVIIFFFCKQIIRKMVYKKLY